MGNLFSGKRQKSSPQENAQAKKTTERKGSRDMAERVVSHRSGCARRLGVADI
jgi:hypothetical protein